MNKTTQRQYAKLIATMGVNIQKDQPVMIFAELDQPDFIRILVEECYRAGAGEVSVEWSYQPLVKLHTRWQKQKTLNKYEAWQEAKLRHRAETLPCMIHIISEDPDGLAGINQEKRAKSIQARYKITKPISDSMENKYQWCIAAVPGEKWAKKVFPELTKSQAVKKLWQAIIECSRASEDPIAAWKAHNADLAARCEYLNSLNLRELRYKASNGTDLTVGLIPDGIFLGGAEPCLGSGVIYNPNIPSEEVFTTPMAGKVEGIVYSSRPLAYRGQLIDNFSIRFENGRVVEVHAEKNEEALKTLVAMDDGAAMLGECALVPYDSPIRNSEIMFYNTLFDENAACHLALGMGFSNCIRDYENYTLEQCREKGVNDSMVHEDFMIGTADLSIVGITDNGQSVQIFKDGNWAF